MKPSILFLVLLLYALGQLCCSSSHHGADITTRIDSLMQSVTDFSGVILVADHGDIEYHKAFGYRDREHHIPVDTSDIFELASLSKQFTAMIIMMLEEEGKLHFDDSLSTYLNGLPYHGITIRQLLTHTSGLPDYQSVMDEHWDKTKIAGNADNIEYLIRYHPRVLFKPGEQYKYSNTGYMLLASIAEKSTGQDFIELCRKRIFRKLNMTSTDIRTRAEKKMISNFALGYINVKGKGYVPADSFPEFNYSIWLGNRKGPGRISSTSSDLLRWDQALYTEELVTKPVLEMAYSPMTLNNDSVSHYGFGWNTIADARLGRIVSHTGDNPGYKTEIVRYIDKNKTIIFLNNNAHERKHEIMGAIRKIVERDQMAN